MRVQFTLQSRNAKTGPIPVTTTDSTSCPPACPFRAGGCYAKGGPLAILWRKLDSGAIGGTWTELCDKVRALPAGQLWRHNQAGDLPGLGDTINAGALAQLVSANMGRNGFTYTHKPMTADNRAAVTSANAAGFTINLSANNPTHADILADTKSGPVVVVLAADANQNTVTPAGRKIVLCPATQRDDVTCQSCGLCARQRDFIIGFPAHGAAKRKAETIATQGE